MGNFIGCRLRCEGAYSRLFAVGIDHAAGILRAGFQQDECALHVAFCLCRLRLFQRCGVSDLPIFNVIGRWRLQVDGYIGAQSVVGI